MYCIEKQFAIKISKSFLMIFLFLGIVSTCFSQVGINTTTPLSTLDINGNLNIKEVGLLNANVLGSGTLFGGAAGFATPIVDGVYISMTPTNLSDEFILPDAVTCPGRIYILRNISNSINAKIYTFGGSFYAKDDSTLTTSPLTMPFDSLLKTVIVISDGQNWTYIF